MDEDLRYSTDHCWGAERAGSITVGVTPYLVSRANGDLRCHLPAVGDTLTLAQPFGALEATKLTVDLYAPCEGTVTDVNAAVLEDASLLRRDPWEAGWMLRVRGRLPPLLTAAAYRARFAGASTWKAS